jgi:hypothetical protein
VSIPIQNRKCSLKFFRQEKQILNTRRHFFAFLGIVVGILLFFTYRAIYPIEPYRCADGWHSPSIGRPGACSHHGGVVGGDTMPRSAGIICIAAGLITFFGFASYWGGFDSPAVRKYESGFIDETAGLIKYAIQHEGKIEFAYTRRGEHQSMQRSIKPTGLFYLSPGQTRSLCVVGHCFLRNAQRTFALTRMSNIKIIE